LDVKIKGKFVPPHDMKAYSGNGGIAHTFLTSALDEGEWPPSYTRHFTFREHRHPLTRRLGRPRASGDILEQRKISCFCRIEAQYRMWQWYSLTLVLTDTVIESGFYTCKTM